MPNPSRFAVIPLSEVPAPVNSVKVGSLEAVLIDDRRTVRGSLGPLKRGAIGYEVQGLPHGQKAWIVKEKDAHQVIRQVHGESEWLGKYTTPEEALQALASKLP
jgi:hypothetical protein